MLQHCGSSGSRVKMNMKGNVHITKTIQKDKVETICTNINKSMTCVAENKMN